MATQGLPVTNTPTEVTGLVTGTQYAFQVRRGSYPVRYASVAGAAAPTDLATYGETMPGETFGYLAKSGETFWAWTARAGETAHLSYDDIS